MGKTFRNIAITGASRGLGAALAAEFAAAGVHLFLSARNETLLAQVAEKCRALGAEVSVQALDVSDRKACSAWVQDIASSCRDRGGFDLMIANAGVSGGSGAGKAIETKGCGVSESDGAETVARADAAYSAEDVHQIDTILNVNVSGVLNTIQPCIPVMKRQGHGHLAIMSSIAGFRGMPGAPAYCASKAAVKVYGEGLRGELAPAHIDVSVICPGFVKSDMTDANDFKMPFLMSAEKAARLMRQGLERRKGRIAFPIPMVFGAWLMSALPDGLVHRLTLKTPAKPPLNSGGS